MCVGYFFCVGYVSSFFVSCDSRFCRVCIVAGFAIFGGLLIFSVLLLYDINIDILFYAMFEGCFANLALAGNVVNFP